MEWIEGEKGVGWWYEMWAIALYCVPPTLVSVLTAVPIVAAAPRSPPCFQFHLIRKLQWND